MPGLEISARGFCCTCLTFCRVVRRKIFAPNKHNFPWWELPRSWSEPISTRRGEHCSPVWSEQKKNINEKRQCSFQAHLHCADANFTPERLKAIDKTIADGRAMLAPTNRFEFRQKFQSRNGQARSLQGAGRDFAPNQHNFTGCETLWFVPLSRYRAGAKNVYVHSQSATEKTTPQSTASTAPLTQGSQCSAEQNLHRSIGKRQFCGFVGNFDTGLTQ